MYTVVPDNFLKLPDPKSATYTPHPAVCGEDVALALLEDVAVVVTGTYVTVAAPEAEAGAVAEPVGDAVEVEELVPLSEPKPEGEDVPEASAVAVRGT